MLQTAHPPHETANLVGGSVMESLKNALSAAIEFGECVFVTEKERGNIGIIPRGVTTYCVLCDIVSVSRSCDAQKRRVKLDLGDIQLA